MSKFYWLVCMVLTLACLPAQGQNLDEKRMVLKSWYQALSPIDRELISSLLLKDAVVELKDYDLVQNKSEFIDALDSWEDAIEGGSIRYKLKDMAGDDGMAAVVCYRFSSNQLMTEETFYFSDGKISKSIQITIADDCAGF